MILTVKVTNQGIQFTVLSISGLFSSLIDISDL